MEGYKNDTTQKILVEVGGSIYSNIFNGQKSQGKQHQKGTFYIDKWNNFQEDIRIIKYDMIIQL